MLMFIDSAITKLFAFYPQGGPDVGRTHKLVLSFLREALAYPTYTCSCYYILNVHKWSSAGKENGNTHAKSRRYKVSPVCNPRESLSKPIFLPISVFSQKDLK